MSIQRRKRPRALTLTLPDDRQPCLVLSGKKYTLRNFSEEGIGLWLVPPAPYNLTNGSKISGDVVIDNSIHPVQLEVMHLSDRGVGLRIVHKSKELDALFERLLEPTVYASRLQLATSTPQEDSSMGCQKIWFKSGTESELVLWYQASAKMIKAVQLTWQGKWVFRSQFEAPVTGQIKDGTELGTGRKLSKNDLIVVHTKADPELLQQAAQFLSSVPQPLPGYLFWQFLESGEQVHLPIENILPKKVA